MYPPKFEFHVSQIFFEILEFSVEADPKTARRCGTAVDIPNEGTACKERLQGANKVLVCKCDTDLCNAASNNQVSTATAILSALAAAIKFFA